MRSLAHRPVYIVGIGIHPYQRPTDKAYSVLAAVAVREALRDASLPPGAIEAVYVSTALLGMASGPPILRALGITGVPLLHVENASASGSSAFRTAAREVAAGFSDIALVLGVDKNMPWRVASDGGSAPTDGQRGPLAHLAGVTRRYAEALGVAPDRFARVAVKNHSNASHNPYAQRRQARTLHEVLTSPTVEPPLTRLQCAPVGEGAAALLLASEEGLGRFRLNRSRAVQLLASSALAGHSGTTSALFPEAALTEAAAQRAFSEANVEPKDLDIVELHDVVPAEELLYLEAMGVSRDGSTLERLEHGEYDIGGRPAVSPSGGLLGMGHPIGPTGVGQLAEITRQLRGEAGIRQQPDARLGLAHMVGIGPVCLIHILQGPTPPSRS